MEQEQEQELLLLSHQTQFVDIYQQIRRSGGDTNMKSLQNLIVSLRRTIMTHKTPSVQKAHFTILKLLFKLIVYTRDICGGLGEREIAYSMLFIWKYHFPVPTAHCLHKIVTSSFGSWRDIKGFCEFIRKHSEKGAEDPFIETCIGLMNHQLNEDARGGENGISLVSRWIPREGSAHGWLFQRCALQWIRAFRPHYLKTVGNSEERFIKAFKKGKKEYRLLCTSLSKATDTLQIKQCANQWDTIDPKHIPMRALSTQQNALLNIGRNGSARAETVLSKDRSTCASKIQSSFFSSDSSCSSSGEHVFVEMGDVIKLALHNNTSAVRIESLWSLILRQIPNSMSHMIPVLDMSLFHTDVELFYHALGMALAIACKGGDQKRMIVFDTTAQLVSLSGSLTQMLDMMKPIFHEHHIGSDLANAFSLYLHEATPAPNDVLVVFCKNKNNKGEGVDMPSILYWAHSDSKATSFVGYTNNTLSRIAELPIDTWKLVTPYLFIQYLLSDKRYDAIDTYFDSILTG